ncbi:hypothetical protein EKD04_005120 [Chloroflexales bacterium ZM16-3]|nr:hypothetical protein [Chloroflexales bacterium ZM16-3]
MIRSPWRSLLIALLLLTALLLLATCGGQGSTLGTSLYVQNVTANPATYAGKEITVDGAYLWRPGDPSISVLALGVNTLDNGLDAQPLGDPIWLEGFPADVTANLHSPGDAVYGFVRVRGQFASGSFGPEGKYPYQITVSSAEPIEQVRRIENAIKDTPLADDEISFFELQRNPEKYNGQTITTQGYYFWNSLIYVLAEGVSTEEDGSSPQPMGSPIWMEGFPPDKSSELNVGANNSYVWGLVEVTGTFQTGGGFGKDGAYQSIFNVTSATPIK